MAITDWPCDERPREKILSKGAQSLSDAELLAVFLRTGCAGKSAVDLARELLSTFGSLSSLFSADATSFCAAKGLGLAKYAQLQAVLEMAKRHLYESVRQQPSLSSSHTVKDFLRAKIGQEQREVFSALFLDTQHRLICYENLFQGTIDSASIYPREVVQRALHHQSAAVIFAHNHPSGEVEPSQSDIAITNTLKKALGLIDIRVLDHIVIGRDRTYSFAEKGLIR